MNKMIKLSGKKVNFPESGLLKWKFEKRPGGWIIGSSNQGHRRRFMMYEFRSLVGAHLGGLLWHGEWILNSRASVGGRSGGGESDLTAQFPGKVRKILVQPGATVLEGDSLVLVEAMKMEFAVRAPYAGQVKNVLVKEGQQLAPGDRLIDLESSQNEKL